MPPDLDAAVQAKVSEIAEVDLHIMATRGELLKFEDRKRELLTNLEAMRKRISDVIDGAAGSKSQIP